MSLKRQRPREIYSTKPRMGTHSRTPITSGFIILFKQKTENQKELKRRNCLPAWQKCFSKSFKIYRFSSLKSFSYSIMKKCERGTTVRKQYTGETKRISKTGRKMRRKRRTNIWIASGVKKKIQIQRSWDGKTDAEESAAPPVWPCVFVHFVFSAYFMLFCNSQQRSLPTPWKNLSHYVTHLPITR